MTEETALAAPKKMLKAFWKCVKNQKYVGAYCGSVLQTLYTKKMLKFALKIQPFNIGCYVRG